MTATYMHVNVLFWGFFLSIICYMYMYMFIWFYIDRLLSVLFKTNVKTNMLEPVQRYRLSVRHELILSKGTLWFPQRNCFQTVNFTGNIILRYRGNSRQTSWREVRRVIDLYPPSSVCPPPPPSCNMSLHSRLMAFPRGQDEIQSYQEIAGIVWASFLLFKHQRTNDNRFANK